MTEPMTEKRRQELWDLADTLDHETGLAFHESLNDNDRLRAENERLTAALNDISTFDTSWKPTLAFAEHWQNQLVIAVACAIEALHPEASDD